MVKTINGDFETMEKDTLTPDEKSEAIHEYIIKNHSKALAGKPRRYRILRTTAVDDSQFKGLTDTLNKAFVKESASGRIFCISKANKPSRHNEKFWPFDRIREDSQPEYSYEEIFEEIPYPALEEASWDEVKRVFPNFFTPESTDYRKPDRSDLIFILENLPRDVLALEIAH